MGGEDESHRRGAGVIATKLFFELFSLCFLAITNNAASVAMIPMYDFRHIRRQEMLVIPCHGIQNVPNLYMIPGCPFGNYSRTIDVDDTRLELDVCIALSSE